MTMSRGAKFGLGVCVFFIVILLIGVAGNVSKVPEQEERLAELYKQCVDENDDIMSHSNAVELCDRTVEDAELFS